MQKHIYLNNIFAKKFIVLILSLSGLLLYSSCKKTNEVSPKTAEQMAIYRNLGLAYLEESDFNSAIEEFQKLTNIAPAEPLGYADLGLCYLNTNNTDQAEKWLLKAHELAPFHPEISLLLAQVYDLTNRENLAVSLLQDVLVDNPLHIKILFKLSQYYIHANNNSLLQKAENNLLRIVSSFPANIAARLNLIEVLLKSAKSQEALQQMESFRQILPELPLESMEIFNKSLDLISLNDNENALTSVIIFHNFLKSTMLYQAALRELQVSPGLLSGEPIQQFVSYLPKPSKMTSGIPASVKFTEVDLPAITQILSIDHDISAADRAGTVLAHADFDGDGDDDLFISSWFSKEKTSRQFLFINTNGSFNRLNSDFGIKHDGQDIFAIFADYDNDGYLDLYINNTSKDRLYHNNGNMTFSDVTAKSGLGISSKANKALFADFDLEGDLDLFIASTSQNRLFRNNLDGTFTEISSESAITANGQIMDSRDVCFADFDDDGDIDLTVVNKNGADQYFDNLRQEHFHEKSAEAGLNITAEAGAMATADYNNDGSPDLCFTDMTGQNYSLYRNKGDGTFERDLSSNDGFKDLKNLAGLDVTFFDLDNDGHQDLLFSGKTLSQSQNNGGLRLFYNDGAGIFLAASDLLPDLTNSAGQTEILDFDNDGDQDIIFVSTDNSVHLLENKGGNINNHHTIRLTGLRTASGKNNYFGIGAKLEVKSASLYQMKTMDQPVAYFGIGDAPEADLVRVIWPNGVTQNVFKPQKEQKIVESQILKGSCPYLYVWNGSAFEFATDVLWPSAIGMPLGIMAGEKVYAFANSTDEYLKVSGENVKAKDRKYIFQFTTELWETPYLDRIKLLAVDHPQHTDIYVNEQFTRPPFPTFRIYSVIDKKLALSAVDGQGNDILDVISKKDGTYVSNINPADFQGIMDIHDIILDLGDLSKADSIYLFLNGWLFPTDASINVNISQSERVNLIPPSLQVIDKQGNWKTVIENMGFPKGKNKTMVFDLSTKFLTNDYRIKITTNMQIYWDYIFYATDVNSEQIKVNDLQPVQADLHFRGFSKVSRKTPYSPHIPDYYNVIIDPKWRDLTGFYTRYGDVLPLLLQSDSKYVIMNAGDEISLLFNAQDIPETATGWKRDFIFYNDGWLKDGDLNTACGQTVEPLPFHGMTHYPYGNEQSYPMEKEYQDYRKEYNIREVTTNAFKRLVINKDIK
jgi:tetratricopeptide (TPR) repeat protein